MDAAAQLSLLNATPAHDVARLRDRVRESARNIPGTYRMLGGRGDVLYVGKSRQVRTRLLSYFRLPWPEHRHARLLRETARIEWEEAPSEFAALLRETRLIRSHRPAYNQRGARPLDRWWVITIEAGPAPRLRVQRASAVASGNTVRGRIVRRAPVTVIGPFAQRQPLVQAVRVLNDALGLRDCSDAVPLVLRDAFDLFANDARYARTPGCHRYETQRCLGPCVAACSSVEYGVQLQRARSYLDGSDDEPRQRLVREMASASAELAYERAGWLRNRLAALETLDAQLARVREALHRPSYAYRALGREGHPDYLYLVRHGRVVGEAAVNDAHALERLIDREQESGTPATALSVDALEELNLLEHWFRTRAEEQAYTAASVRELLH